MVKNCRIKLIFAILPFFVFLKTQNSVKAGDFLEKITPEEFLEILKTQEPEEFLFDEKQAGGIQIPDSPYAKKQIKKYIEQYTRPFGKRQLSEILDNGELYRLYVRQELKKKNLPAALEYLPVVESEYKPLAVSKSGARGLWQFMDNSIAGLLKKLFNVSADADMEPEALSEYLLSVVDTLSPKDEKEAYLIKMVKGYEPLPEHDEQMKELFAWGEQEPDLWQVKTSFHPTL